MKPTVLDVLPLVRAIYKRHVTGCCLHILTDDGNVENQDAQFCLEQARASGHADCLAAAELLAQMTKTQRLKVSRSAPREASE